MKEVIIINKNLLSPYVRLAILSELCKGFHLSKRIIYDYELIYVCGGMADITVDGTVYRCKKNDVILIRPGISHSFDCVGNENFIQPHIHFDAVYSDTSEETPVCFKDVVDMDDYERSLIREDIIIRDIPTVFVPSASQKFSELFFGVISLYQSRSTNVEILLKIKMLEMLSLIFSQFAKASSKEEKICNRSDTDPAVLAKNHMDNNFLQRITLEGLQRQFYVNKFTLTRNFKRLYQKSPIAYYRDLRLNYAKVLLHGTNRSIASIAEELNFPDIYTFSRFFKKSIGMSPNQYKRYGMADSDDEYTDPPPGEATGTVDNCRIE